MTMYGAPLNPQHPTLNRKAAENEGGRARHAMISSSPATVYHFARSAASYAIAFLDQRDGVDGRPEFEPTEF